MMVRFLGIKSPDKKKIPVIFHPGTLSGGGGGVKSLWNVLPLFMVAIRVYRWIQKRIENSNAYMAVVFVFAI